MELNQETELNKKAQAKNRSPEAEIRQICDEIFAAMEAKDIEKLMSFYASDVVAFDVMSPLQFIGKASYKKSWIEAFEMCSDSDESLNEVHEVSITANESLAFVHSIRHNLMIPKDGGEKMEMWMRATQCFERLNDKWLITHEQFSVPVDFESNKALFNLKPEKVTSLH